VNGVSPGLRSWLFDRRFAVLVLLAVLAGGYLRYVDLASVPPALNQDEAVNGYDAYSLALTGRDHLGHPFPFAGLESFGDWASPLLTFTTAPVVGVFGLSVSTIRAVSATFGLATIPLIYLLGWQFFQRRSIGILAAWLVALSVWAIHLSRWAIPVAAVPAMVTLTMLAIVWAVRRGSSRGIVASGVVAGLAVMTYPTMKLYVPLLLVAALLIYRRAIARCSREALLYAAICFAVIAGPVIVLSTIDPGGRARLDQVSVLHQPGVGPLLLLQQYTSYFSPDFLFNSGDGDPMHSPLVFGLEPRTLIPFLLAGVVWMVYWAFGRFQFIRRRLASEGDAQGSQSTTLDSSEAADWRQSSCQFVLAALLLYPIPGSLTLPNPQTLRAAHLLPLNALIAAAGAVALFELAARLLNPAPELVRRGVLAILVLVALVPMHNEWHDRIRYYFDTYPTAVAKYFQFGLQQALEYARAHASGFDEIWVTDTNQPYIYVLFLNQVSPNDVHTSLPVVRDPPQFNQVPAFENYRFLGLPPGVTAESLPLLTTVLAPDGSVAYQVRGGTAPNGRRVMLIER
jgi:4-amino-4-deoxy-L-arabinose transferase-like glycosyltransferase